MNHSRPAPLFWLALAASGGIGITALSQATPICILYLAIIFSTLSLYKPIQWICLLLATFFCFWLFSLARICSVSPTDLRALIGTHPQTCNIWGTIVTPPNLPPEIKTSKNSFVLKIEKIQKIFETEPTHGNILIQYKSDTTLPLQIGDRIHFTGFVTPFRPPSNPGEFNYPQYMSTKLIYYEALPDISTFVVNEQAFWASFLRLGIQFRDQMITTLNHNPWWEKLHFFDQKNLKNTSDVTALIRAILLGYREGISDDLYENFRTTGTLHLFAVSGQNVAVITLLLFFIMQLMGLLKWRWSWTLIPLIFFFCFATGMSASATRAFLMAMLIFIGWMFYQPIGVLNILGATALLIYIIHPNEFFNVGFQLSFIVIAALVLLGSPLYKLFTGWIQLDPWIPKRLIPKESLLFTNIARSILGISAISIAAWLGSAPLCMYYFYQFTPITVLTNVLITPLADTITIFCGLSACLGWIWLGFSTPLNWMSSLLLQLMVLIVNFCAHIPFGHCYTNPRYWIEKPPAITLIQTDNATPVFIQTSHNNCIIDPGSKWNWQYLLNPLRRERGCNHFHELILTQSTASHISAALSIMDETDVEKLVLPINTRSRIQTKIMEKSEAKKISSIVFKAGENKKIDDINLQILWPETDTFTNRSDDETLVFLVHVQNKKILWAGNISSNIEQILIKKYPSLKTDVLIQGARGYSRNLSYPWLNQLKPHVIIRPWSRFNSDLTYNSEFENYLKQMNIQWLDMKKTGAIFFENNPSDIQIRTFLTNETIPL
jgi:ComEC/Rec2-related protein